MGFGGGSSSSSSKTKQPKWARQLGESLAGGFKATFGGPGFTTGLTQPLGIIGNQYQNLFGDNPTSDFLGARGTLERTLSGAAMGDYYNQAFNFLAPGAQRATEEAARAIRSQLAGKGLRFSSDLGDLTGRAASDIWANTAQQAMQGASQLYGNQMNAAMGIYDLIGSLGTGQLQRQIPLAISLATGTPVMSNSHSSSWNASVQMW